jgi:hypothetical protein
VVERLPVWSVPTLATLNPIGAPKAHVGLHVGAVVHNYDTELRTELERRPGYDQTGVPTR